MFGRGARDFMLAGLGADQIQDDDSAEDVSVSGGLSYDADNSFSRRVHQSRASTTTTSRCRR